MNTPTRHSWEKLISWKTCRIILDHTLFITERYDHSISLSLSLCRSLTLSLLPSLPLSLSHSNSLSPYLSISLSLYLSIFRSLSASLPRVYIIHDNIVHQPLCFNFALLMHLSIQSCHIIHSHFHTFPRNQLLITIYNACMHTRAHTRSDTLVCIRTHTHTQIHS